MQKEHYILNELYRPSTLEGYVCDDIFKQKVEGWIEQQNIPHLFLHGKAGSGKTTLAKIIARNIDCDYIMINATDKRGIEDIKNEILPFVSVMSFKSAPKIVILDEATHILQAGQVLLLNMIETYSLNTRFILTGNYPERLIEPLRSRLEDYNLKPPSKKHVAKHIVNILDTENIQYEISDVAAIINAYYPDLRRIINNVQKHVIDNKLSLSQTLTNDADTENNLIQLLSKKHSKTFGEIRKLIADSEISDFDSLYKKLYTDIEKYASGNEGLVIITINEHIFQSASVIDKEICFFACIALILETI
jgi:DNA polymerase III delta prime subunit